MAEALFLNGQPFQLNRLEDFGRTADPELEAAGRRAYNRWLADFCAEAPGRRSGQAVVSFDETQLFFLVAAIGHVDQTLSWNDDWMAFARSINPRTIGTAPRQRTHRRKLLHRRVSIRSPPDAHERARRQRHFSAAIAGFPYIGTSAAMFGLDYPHFEWIVPHTMEKVQALVGDPSVTGDDARKVLFENAAQLYGFDPAVLRPHVDRVGFEVGDVLAVTASQSRTLSTA